MFPPHWNYKLRDTRVKHEAWGPNPARHRLLCGPPNFRHQNTSINPSSCCENTSKINGSPLFFIVLMHDLIASFPQKMVINIGCKWLLTPACRWQYLLLLQHCHLGLTWCQVTYMENNKKSHLKLYPSGNIAEFFASISKSQKLSQNPRRTGQRGKTLISPSFHVISGKTQNAIIVLFKTNRSNVEMAFY